MSDRLRQARIDAGFENASDAARRFGWKEPTYLSHENGSRGLTPKAAETYARAFKVKPEWLLFGKHGGYIGKALMAGLSDDVYEKRLVDVFDVHASAGHGAIVGNEDVVERLSFPMNYLERLTKTKPANLAIIGVKGDSMEPTLKDDDVVMLDLTKTNLDYDGLFVLRWGDALHVKRIGRGKSGSVKVISDNSAIYPPIDIARDEVAVVGKVIWKGQKL